MLNTTARTTNRNSKLLVEPNDNATIRQTLPLSTALIVDAATDGWYKATLPDGTLGYIRSSEVRNAGTLRKLTLKQEQPLLDAPDSATAARKAMLMAGAQVNIKASFKNYYLVTDDEDNAGWINAGK